MGGAQAAQAAQLERARSIASSARACLPLEGKRGRQELIFLVQLGPACYLSQVAGVVVPADALTAGAQHCSVGLYGGEGRQQSFLPE